MPESDVQIDEWIIFKGVMNQVDDVSEEQTDDSNLYNILYKQQPREESDKYLQNSSSL